MDVSWCPRRSLQLFIVFCLSLLLVLGVHLALQGDGIVRAAEPRQARSTDWASPSTLRATDLPRRGDLLSADAAREPTVSQPAARRSESVEASALPMVGHPDGLPPMLPARTWRSINPPGTAMDPGGWLPTSASRSGGNPILGSTGPGDAMAAPIPGAASFVVDLTSDRVWGLVSAGDTVTVTVNGTQVGASLADDVGFFWTTLFDASGDRVDVAPGDAVVVYAEGSVEATVTARAIACDIDLVGNIVTGTVAGLTSGSVDLYPGFDAPTMASQSWTASIDGSGQFSYDFAGEWDFGADDGLVVAYGDSGFEVQKRFHANGLVVLPWPLYNIVGYATPNTSVTVTVVMSDGFTTRADATVQASADTGRYEWRPGGGELEVTDIVFAEMEGGDVLSRTVDNLELISGAAQDRLLGVAEPGAKIIGRANVATAQGWQTVQAESTVDAGGLFTIEMGAEGDLWPGTWYGVYVPDAEGDDLVTWAPAQGAVAVDVYNSVVWGFAPGPPAGVGAGATVSMTLYDAGSASETEYTVETGWFGEYTFTVDDHGLPELEVGDVVTVEKHGFAWQGVVEILTLTHSADTALNRITGEAEPTGSPIYLDGRPWQDWAPQDLYPVAGRAAISTTASSPWTVTPAGLDVRGGFSYWVERRNAEGNHQDDFGATASLRAWPGGPGVSVHLPASGTPFTLTLRDGGGNEKAAIETTYDARDGESQFVGFGEQGVDFLPGDQLELLTSDGFTTSVEIVNVSVIPDLAANTVSGTAPPNQSVVVKVGSTWEEIDADMGFVPTGPDGSFLVDVSQLPLQTGDGVVTFGESATVCGQDFAGNQVCAWYAWPRIIANYNMEGGSQVWGNSAAPESTVLITVTNLIDEVIATATTTAGTCQDCGPADYAVDLPDDTVAPGNTVTANFGDGWVESTVVAGITANIDAGADVVTGTAPAERGIHLNVEHFWGDWGDLDTDVDASGMYTAEFQSDIGWDIVPGDSFNAHVSDDRGHETQYSFWLPAPELSVQKERLSGYVRPGGLVVYRIDYWNDGIGTSEQTYIHDTIPVSTTYVDETSGEVVGISGRNVYWFLYDVEAGTGGSFYVTLGLDTGIMTGSEALDQNCVVITSTTPGELDPGNNGSCAWHYDIWESDVDVSVDKWPNPSDPAPGEELEYTVNVCTGHGGAGTGAATGPVWLTDTLPVSTSLVSWSVEPEHEQALWEEVTASDDELVLYAPGLPGEWCHDVRIRLELDPLAPVGMWLENVAEVYTDGDIDPDNDRRVNTDAVVSEPRYDLRLDKWYNQGVQIPGGYLGFGIGFASNGNSAADARITDTLPTGTTYIAGSAYLPGDPHPTPFDPVLVDGDTIVWDLGAVGVGEGGDFWFEVEVDGDAVTGTVENCATIGSPLPDADPSDNDACASVDLYDPGPNLAVEKWANYNQGDDRIGYTVRVLNIGDEIVDNIVVTDTYPLDTYFTGDQDVDGEYPFIIDGPYDDPGNRTLTWTLEYLEPGWSWQAWFDIGLDDPGAALRTYTNTVEVTTPDGDPSPEDNIYTDVQFSGGEMQNVDLVVGETRIWACARPGGGPMTVTTAYEEYEFGECFDEWLNNPMMPGDTVTVSAGAGALPVVIEIPTPFEALGDSVTDKVTGQIDSLDSEEVEGQLHGSGTAFTTQTDASGHFTATLSDIPRGGEGEVRWYTQVSYADVGYHRNFGTLDIVLQVNEAHEWVQGNYEAGHSGVVTVTDSGGSVKATALITTGTVPDWGPGSRPGFSTNTAGWSGEQPDIQPGDWVHAGLTSGYTASVHVGTITGYVDAAADTITGTVYAEELSDPVPVQCEPWGAPEYAPNPASKYDQVTPDGSNPYSCSWDPATEWDVEPGQDIGVFYTDPDAHQVFSAFYEPAPYLRIEKQVPGWSRPAEGGNFVFEITVWNDGGADAEGVVVTDTMDGLSYLTDTSGIIPTGSGSGPIIWNLGTVAAGATQRFRLFAQIDAPAPDTVTNTVEAATANPFNQSSWEERTHWWTDQVQPNGTQLNLGKWAWQAPAPGYDAIFTLNACGNGETASTAVTLTDSLPPSMTLKSWWADDPGWQQVLSETHTLVVAIPSLPGQGNCSAVYLRAGLDPAAEVGIYITNTATITASNDLDPGDNEAFWDGWVNHPYQNLYIDKWFNGGTAVPGGELRFSIGYGNEGSIPVDGPIYITDTMPAGTSFSEAWWYDNDGPHPMDPMVIDGQTVVWDVGSLESGENGQFDVHLSVDTGLVPPAVVTNCAKIGGAVFDENPYDNDACFAQPIAQDGTNLAIHKDGWWEDTQRAGYGVLIENLGTTRVDNVMITDTLPVSATLDPNWGIDFHRWWQGGGDSSTLTATIEYMEPGETAWLNFSADFADPLPYGVAIANTVQVTTPSDDVNASDNEHTQVLYTGPDLAVEKWGSAGNRRPGSLLTYTLHIENEAWWGGMGDVWVTDTLPADVTFVDAVWRLCGPDGYFCPAPPDRVEGNAVGWEWASGGFGSWWQDLVVTVRISDTVQGGELLSNEATIGSNDPGDIEPDYTNNTSVSIAEILNPVFAVSKEAESSGVAGMPLTYTLTLTNTGNLTDTNIVLSDTVPLVLTDIDTDGDYSNGDVTWLIGELVPGGLINGWISGLLPCTLQDVVNDQYYVIESDEGLMSPLGPAVTTAVVAPSINVSLADSGPAVVNETVYFTATASTDGTPLTYQWNFGAGPEPGTAAASHVFNVDGSHPVTVTVTDGCGYDEQGVIAVEITPPALVADFTHEPDPAVIVFDNSVAYTDTSTTDGPAIVAWAWDFGDGGTSGLQHPTYVYESVGIYDVSLTVTDSLGYSDTVLKPNLVTVTSGCVPLTSVDSLAWSPSHPVIHETVTFTATTSPAGATQPINYTWAFGDAQGTAGTAATVQHAYAITGTLTVSVTAVNPCTPAGVTRQVELTVLPLKVFLPLVVRDTP